MAATTVTFHGVGRPARELEPAERDVWVEDLDELRRMLDVLALEPLAHVTFDDGNVSDVETAVPLLHERGLTATFFLLPGFFGTRGYLDADDARGLVESGMRVGSHGMLHRPWRGLPAEHAHAELVESRAVLAQTIGRDVDEAACPFGAYDRRAIANARAAGYRRLYTSDGGPSLGAWLEPRTSVHRVDTAEDVRDWVTRTPSARVTALRAAKRAVKRWR